MTTKEHKQAQCSYLRNFSLFNWNVQIWQINDNYKTKIQKNLSTTIALLYSLSIQNIAVRKMAKGTSQ